MKVSSRIIVFLLLICTFSLFGRLSIRFDEQSFSARASVVGNKSANIEELVKVTDALNRELKGGQKIFSVPDPFAITHNEIVDFLKRVKLPNGIAYDLIMEQWAHFKERQPIDSPVLTPQAKQSLSTIRTIIESAFSNFFALSDPQRQQMLENFIKSAATKKQLLMVRSTGREDSKEFANAGGNESIASVKPGIYFMSKAIGKVVASYFSERSFNQRILSGNKRELFADPFMPALLQVMIGERPGAKDSIPVSGVIFSQEAEGLTPGVVSISSTWGHGEGVVNGLVPVDQFFVGLTDIIHGLIRIKTERIKSNNKYQLSAFANPGPLQRESSLTPEQINNLVLAARELELYYRWPQDIEFIIQDHIIYLVQTRPIVSPTIKPSYVKDEYIALLPEDAKKDVYVIGSGGGAVQIINKEENIIIADTITHALDTFLNRTDKDDVKAVIIGQIAPATSHEATNFRGAGKPIFYTKDLTSIEQWTKRQLPIMLDPQRGLAVRFIKTDKFANPKDVLTMNEWLIHPIAKKTSILPQFWITSLAAIDEKLQSIKPKKDISTTMLLAALAKASTEPDVIEILATLNARIHNVLATAAIEQKTLRTAEKETYPALMQNLMNLHSQFLTCAFEIMNIAPTISQLSRITWLYPQVFLEALVRQVPYPQEFVDDYSLGSLVKIEREEEKIVEKLSLAGKELRASYAQLAKASKFALVEQIQESWKTYVKNLSTINEKKQAQVIEAVAYVTTLDIMPLWLNLSFFNAWDQANEDVDACSKILIEEFTGSKNQLDDSAQIMKRLQSFNTSQFEKPELFEKTLKAFEQNILSYFLAKTFPDTFDSAPQLAKFALLMTLNKLVEVFDTSIKTLESSREYTDQELQARRFKQMIEVDFALLKQLVSIKSIAPELKSLLDEHTFKTIEEYLNHIQELLSVLIPSASQLQPSSGFNVSGAALGSHALWVHSIGEGGRGLRQTIEDARQQKLVTLVDIFTLIHQNILVTIGALFSKTAVNQLPLPSSVAELHHALQSYTYKDKGKVLKVSFIGFNIEKDILTYYYNMPLYEHSNTFSVSYNLKTKTTIFKVNFIGPAWGRWINIANMTVLFSVLSNIEFACLPETDNVRGLLTFCWQITDLAIIPLMFKFLDRAQSYSFGKFIGSSNWLNEIAFILAPSSKDEFVAIVIQRYKNLLEKNLYNSVVNQRAAIVLLNALIASQDVKPNIKNALFVTSEPFLNVSLESPDSQIRLGIYDLLIDATDQGLISKLIVKSIVLGIRSQDSLIQLKAYRLFSKAIKKHPLLEGLDSETVKRLLNYTATKIPPRLLDIFSDQFQQLIALEKAKIIKNYDSFLTDLFKMLHEVAPKISLEEFIKSINMLFDQKDLTLSKEEHEKIIQAIVNKYKDLVEEDPYFSHDALEAIDTLKQDKERIREIITQWEEEQKK